MTSYSNYGNRQNAVPPYNATNFTSDNTIYSTMRQSAITSPYYPLDTGSDAQQIATYRQNLSYFNGINQQTQDIKNMNSTMRTSLPYPQFKTNTERIMYLQALTLNGARNKIIGPGSSSAVPVSTIYNIINNN